MTFDECAERLSLRVARVGAMSCMQPRPFSASCRSGPSILRKPPVKSAGLQKADRLVGCKCFGFVHSCAAL
jgi:hypothetical protein